MNQSPQQATEAFARIVREYQKAVFAAAYAKIGNAHDAEDIKQEVFIEAWRNLHKLQNPEKVPGWLYIATINRCKDHFRKTARQRKHEAVFVESKMMEPSHLHPTDEEAQAKVHEALLLLPEKFRVIIMLKHFVHLSYEEISKMTGLSKTTIDGRLRGGKRKLKEKLTDMGIEADWYENV